MPLDAKRNVMKYQVSTTTHTATGRDQSFVGLIQPPPGPEKVNLNDHAKNSFMNLAQSMLHVVVNGAKTAI